MRAFILVCCSWCWSACWPADTPAAHIRKKRRQPVWLPALHAPAQAGKLLVLVDTLLDVLGTICRRRMRTGHAGRTASSAVQLGQFLKCRHQPLAIHLHLGQLIERVIVGITFLRLRELCIDDFFGQVTQLRCRQGGCHAIAGSAGGSARGRYRIRCCMAFLE